MSTTDNDVIINMDTQEQDRRESLLDDDAVSYRIHKDDSLPVTQVSTADKDQVDIKIKQRTDSVDGKNSFQSKKNVAEGMMDIALLTANANQLRFLITYNSDSKTFYFSVGLIVLSLILQVSVGIALIFKRQMKNRGRRDRLRLTNDFLVGGVFIITVINVFVASFTTTESEK